MARYDRISPSVGSPAYEQGKHQRAISIERYHYLVASLQKLYTIRDIQTTMGPMPVTRQEVSFSPYKACVLKPLVGKFHPREDGTIHQDDLQSYVDTVANNWKMSEGGVLYIIAEPREFFNLLFNYHSPAGGTTGIEEWDVLFGRLRAEGFPKKIIPCMASAICSLHHSKSTF